MRPSSQSLASIAAHYKTTSVTNPVHVIPKSIPIMISGFHLWDAVRMSASGILDVLQQGQWVILFEAVSIRGKIDDRVSRVGGKQAMRMDAEYLEADSSWPHRKLGACETTRARRACHGHYPSKGRLCRAVWYVVMGAPGVLIGRTLQIRA